MDHLPVAAGTAAVALLETGQMVSDQQMELLPSEAIREKFPHSQAAMAPAEQ